MNDKLDLKTGTATFGNVLLYAVFSFVSLKIRKYEFIRTEKRF